MDIINNIINNEDPQGSLMIFISFYIISLVVIFLLYSFYNLSNPLFRKEVINIFSYDSFLRGLIAILIVGLSMTIFELCLYYIPIKKTFNSSIDNSLKQIYIGKYPIISGISEGLKITQEEAGERLNNYKLGIIVMEIIIILLVVVITWVHLNNVENKKINLSKVRNIKKFMYRSSKYNWGIIPNSIFVFVILMAIDIAIFFFAQSYKFGDTDEIKLRFVNSILKYQGKEQIEIPDTKDLNTMEGDNIYYVILIAGILAILSCIIPMIFYKKFSKK